MREHMQGEVSDLILFFGRFHPLILHAPIGFLLLAFILEVACRFRQFEHLRSSVRFVLILGTVSAIIAAVLGLMLAQSGGYEDDLLAAHQWSGIVLCLLCVLLVFLKTIYDQRPSPTLYRAYMTAFALMVIALSLAGHYGGSLTHGSDYLTRYMPDGLRKLVGVEVQAPISRKVITNLDSAVVYSDIIDPILSTYCTSCHNESKRKGDLMMHTQEAMLEGGESGKLFVPGDAAKSLMIERLLLPEDHEDHMPPEGKRQMSEDEIELLTWWVNEGASFDKTVAQVQTPEHVKATLNKLVAGSQTESETARLLKEGAPMVDQQLLLQYRMNGVVLGPLSDEVNWLQLEIAPYVKSDSILSSMSPLAANITWLNLAGTPTTDKGVSYLGNFKHVTRLHLGNTKVTDAGLSHLKSLTYLESLNLVGTGISDKGILALSGLKNLRRIYLWKTEVTSEGASTLKKALPNVQINLGSEVSSVQ